MQDRTSNDELQMHHFQLSALEFLLIEYAAGRQPQDRDVTSAQAFLTELGAHRQAITVAPTPNAGLDAAEQDLVKARTDVEQKVAHRDRVAHSAKTGIAMEDLDAADAAVKSASGKVAEAQKAVDELQVNVTDEERKSVHDALGKAKVDLGKAEARQASYAAGKTREVQGAEAGDDMSKADAALNDAHTGLMNAQERFDQLTHMNAPVEELQAAADAVTKAHADLAEAQARYDLLVSGAAPEQEGRGFTEERGELEREPVRFDNSLRDPAV